MQRKGKTEELNFTGTVEALLRELGINPETVLVTRDKKLLTKDTALANKDSIRILSVISGG
ncbi:MoaD/ThiS family protein [Candidatus Woesearchaeota archaeon]|nr:MoaD/ThiS family protein [Candidatus Woesearchaeota archaeon]